MCVSISRPCSIWIYSWGKFLENIVSIFRGIQFVIFFLEKNNNNKIVSSVIFCKWQFRIFNSRIPRVWRDWFVVISSNYLYMLLIFGIEKRKIFDVITTTKTKKKRFLAKTKNKHINFAVKTLLKNTNRPHVTPGLLLY